MNSSAGRLHITANQLLAALPGSALSLIEPHFTSVSVAAGNVVHQVGDRIDHIYFPTDGIASLQMVMRDGRAIDTAIVGRDGALGPMASLSPHRSLVRCVVRSTMTAFKIPAVKFRRAAAESIAVRMIDIYCKDRLLSQTQTSAARYACLSIDARLAACLLDVSSLLTSDSIFLKQDVLAEMLAVRRTSVTEVGLKLRASGIISYSRGSITILGRARLLKLSQGDHKVR
jgi:CRP-like cAMP-binding protein